MKRARALAAIALLAPGAASANVPALYVFVSIFHLFIGCALLGVAEGWLIARVFRLPKKRTVPWMILANYFSAWVGFALPAVVDFPPPLAYVNAYLWIAIAFFFALTLILEWPFVYAAFKGDPRRFGRSIRASLVAQGASYALLVLVYLGTGWQQGLDRVESEYASWAEPQTVVYYVAPDGKTLNRVRLHEARPERVLELDGRAGDVALAADRASPDSDRMDLWAGETPVVRDAGRFPEAALQRPHATCREMGSYCTVDLRSGEAGARMIRNVYTRGIGLEGEQGGDRTLVGMETVFLRLVFRHATVLPGDQVVFEVAYSGLPWRRETRPQVCLLDSKSGRLAVIAEGRSPVTLVDAAAPTAR